MYTLWSYCYRDMSNRYIASHVAFFLLIGILQPKQGVYCLPERNCNIRQWYVNMLADGHLTEVLTQKQFQAKSELDSLLKQAKINNNDMVSCDILKGYYNVFKNKEQGFLVDKEGGLSASDADQKSSKDTSQDKDLNMGMNDETEFGDDTEFGDSEGTEETLFENLEANNVKQVGDSGSKTEQTKGKSYSHEENVDKKKETFDSKYKIDDSGNKNNIEMNKTVMNEARKVHTKKKKRKVKPVFTSVYISNIIRGICFRGSSLALQYLLEVKVKKLPAKNYISKSISVKCLLKRSCSNHCFYVTILEDTKCLPEYSDESFSKNENSDREKIEVNKNERKINKLTASKQVDIKKSVENINVDNSLKGKQTSGSYKAKVNIDSESEKEVNLEKAEESQGKNQNDHRSSYFDFVRFEQQLTLKANEYETKIQALELMIIRLENKLLSEKLSQQNDTGSFAKLENQILKVENELLKLNQSYFLLREENEMLKKRQGKYLELAHVRSQKDHQANSTKHNEMITQQQMKITQLKSMIQNHSDLFDKLQRKHTQLEEQNQILHQIVMNQTAIISSIMKKMQELADDNTKQRQETQSLKARLDIQTTSSDILEKLEHLVSDKISSRHSRVDSVKETENKNHQTNKFFPENPTAWVDKKWDCHGNKSPRFCLLYSLIISPCPPFSPLRWTKCRYLSSQTPDTASYRSDEGYKFDTNVLKLKQELKIADGEHKNRNAVEAQTTITRIPKIKERKNHITDERPQAQEISLKQKNEIKKEKQKFKIKETTGENVKPYKKAETINAEKKIVQKDARKVENEKQDMKEKTSEKIVKTEEKKTDENIIKKKAEKQVTEKKEISGVKDEIKEKQIPPENKNKDKTVENIQQQNIEKTQRVFYTEEGLDKPKDCYGWYEMGQSVNRMYRIYLPGSREQIPVLCDMRKGGWTIIMKRVDGSVDFNRNWNDYKTGFGGVYSEHWIGNDNLHYLTNQDYYMLRVEIVDWERQRRYAEYEDFWIENEDENYRLHVHGYSGDAGDGFLRHSNMMFSTYDRDNDLLKETQMGGSCSKRFKGGGWYYRCYNNNLFGIYYKSEKIPEKRFDGITWKPWKGPNNSMKEIVLKIRPRHANDL